MAIIGESNLAVYLSQGRVAATFKPSNAFPKVTVTTMQQYSDTDQHHVRVVFDDGRLTVTVDDIDEASTGSKIKNEKNV